MRKPLQAGKKYWAENHGVEVTVIGWAGCPDGWVEVEFDDAHTEMVPHSELSEILGQNAEVWDGDAQAGTREKTSSPFPAPSCSPLPESPKD